MQQFSVAVHNQYKRKNEAEKEKTDYVGHVVCCFCGPVDAAGRTGTLRAILAPPEKRRNHPHQRVDPGESDAQENLLVSGDVGLHGPHHGAVTFI